MKSSFIIALLLWPAVVSGEEARVLESRHQESHSKKAPRAWLGLCVSKPDETITAHVPSLPPGVGFVVTSLDEGGPADSAGLQDLDLLWKLGDQMLVNEAQLATLLRLSRPGEEVRISAFRGGQPLELKLTLGKAPAMQPSFGGELAEAAILPGVSGGPMRVVNVSEKSASFTADEGTATVHRDGEIYEIRITGPEDKPIYEGQLSKESGLEQIPEDWRRRIQVLCRTLDHAIGGDMSVRQPRPRVVPPPQGVR